jgi:hypothetical protein
LAAESIGFSVVVVLFAGVCMMVSVEISVVLFLG